MRVIATPLLVFALIASRVHGGGTFRWDRELVEYFDRRYYDFTALRDIAEVLVYLGLVSGAAIAALLLLGLVTRGLRRQALFWALAILGAVLFTPALKWVVRRPQIGDPEGGYSFPSGNAMVSLAFVLGLFLLLPQLRRIRVLPIASAVLLVAYGAALVMLLWHFPSDVLAGWCIALAWVPGIWVALGTPVVPDLAVGTGFPALAKRR